MDANRFDYLAKAVSAGGTRRGLVRLLAALPLTAWLAVLLGEEESPAKTRRKARQGPSQKARQGRRGQPQARAPPPQAQQPPRPPQA